MREEIKKEDWQDSEDFKFTQMLYEDTDKGALVALYYALLVVVAEETKESIFDIHNDLIDDIEDAQQVTTEVH